MAHYRIELQQDFRRPVAEVYALLADHERLGSVFGVPVHRVRDAAGADLNGVGSVRRLRIGPSAIEETVVAAVPDQAIEYRISKGGAPIRRHRGALQFSATAQGARVDWQIEFDCVPLIGDLLRAALAWAIARGLRRAAA